MSTIGLRLSLIALAILIFALGFLVSILVVDESLRMDLQTNLPDRNATATVESRYFAPVVTPKPTSVKITPTAIRIQSTPTAQQIQKLTNSVEAISLWLEVFAIDLVECHQSGILDWMIYADIFQDFGEITGLVGQLMSIRELTGTEYADLQEIVELTEDLVRDINFRCDLSFR